MGPCLALGRGAVDGEQPVHGGPGQREDQVGGGAVDQRQRHVRPRLAVDGLDAGAAQRQRAGFGVVPGVGRERVAALVEPGDVRHAGQHLRLAVHEVRPAQGGAGLAQRDQARGISEQRPPFGLRAHRPVQPRDRVVLAIGVVVALLRAAEFVAAQQHRRAVGEQDGGQQRARHPGPLGQDGGVVGRAFDAPVGAAVVVVAVAVVFAVGFVVPVGVADHVAQREAVVRGGIVDRGPRPPVAPPEQIAAAREPRGQLRALPGVAAPEAPDAVAEAVVPFGEAGRMVAELVAVGPDIPRLGDRLDGGEHRVLPHGIEEPRAWIEAEPLAPQRHAQVEAEAVDVAGVDPVAQRIHHHLQHARMRQVERIAAARVVDVVALLARHQPVVARVVQPAERQRRPQLVAFAGVVEHHVEQHLDARRVQPPDRHLHLVQGGRRQVSRLRREERQRAVAPVVAQAALDQEAVLQEGVHGQQLHRRHTQRSQMLDEDRIGQGRKGAALGRQQIVAQHRCAAHVHLVDHRARPRRVGPHIVAPVERLVRHHGLGAGGCAVAPVERQIGAGGVQAIAEQRIGPAQRAHQAAGIGVEQQLVRIEAVAAIRLPRAVGTVAVDQARFHAGQVAVPDFIGALRQWQARQLLAAGGVEQAEIDAGGVGREDGEIDAQAVPLGA